MLWILSLPVENVHSLNDGMRAALSHVTEGVLESPLLSCVFTWKHNVMGVSVPSGWTRSVLSCVGLKDTVPTLCSLREKVLKPANISDQHNFLSEIT